MMNMASAQQLQQKSDLQQVQQQLTQVTQQQQQQQSQQQAVEQQVTQLLATASATPMTGVSQAATMHKRVLASDAAFTGFPKLGGRESTMFDSWALLMEATIQDLRPEFVALLDEAKRCGAKHVDSSLNLGSLSPEEVRTFSSELFTVLLKHRGIVLCLGVPGVYAHQPIQGT